MCLDLGLHQPVLHLDNALNLQVDCNAVPLQEQHMPRHQQTAAGELPWPPNWELHSQSQWRWASLMLCTRGIAHWQLQLQRWEAIPVSYPSAAWLMC